MAANLEFQRVKEWGWLRGFANLFRKENRAWWGTRRWWINALIWPLMLGGLVANMMFVPTIINLASAEEVASAGGTTAYVILLGISVFFEFGIQAIGVGAVILSQDLLVDERQSGVAEWLLTKPVTRRAYVLAKLLTNVVFVLLFLIVVPSSLIYGLFYLRAGEAYSLLPFLSGVGIMALHTLFYVTFAVMLGAFTNSRLPILGIALGSLLGGGIIGSFVKPALYVTPWILSKLASLVVSGQTVPDGLFWSPIIATALWCVIFVILALVKFEKVEF
jgi:ABC-2 type transport system permease protein